MRSTTSLSPGGTEQGEGAIDPWVVGSDPRWNQPNYQRWSSQWSMMMTDSLPQERHMGEEDEDTGCSASQSEPCECWRRAAVKDRVNQPWRRSK
jgi:hypothetical protein